MAYVAQRCFVMTYANVLPPVEYLKEMFSLNAETGELLWNTRPTTFFAPGKQSQLHNAATWNKKHAGKIAGKLDSRGYRQVRIVGKLFKAARVVVAIHTGVRPGVREVVDHKNGIVDDNRPTNLRVVSVTENMQNRTRMHAKNTSGITGVSWNKGAGKWAATASDVKTKRQIHLGVFIDIKDAISARRSFAEQNYAGLIQHAELRK